MNEKQKIEETIIKNLQNKVTILKNLPHGKAIISEMNYIQIGFNDIFDKIESYSNPYEGIIRLEKKRKGFGNHSTIDDFKRNDKYDYEKNIRIIIKDEIDKNFEYYSNAASMYIRESMQQEYIEQELHVQYCYPLHQLRFDSIPDNMEYEEYECPNGLTNRLRERLLQQIFRY